MTDAEAKAIAEAALKWRRTQLLYGFVFNDVRNKAEYKLSDLCDAVLARDKSAREEGGAK